MKFWERAASEFQNPCPRLVYVLLCLPVHELSYVDPEVRVMLSYSELFPDSAADVIVAAHLYVCSDLFPFQADCI